VAVVRRLVEAAGAEKGVTKVTIEKNCLRFACVLLVCVLLSLPAAAQSRRASCWNAELIVQGAKIITMGPSERLAEAMAVRDGRIIAIGDKKSVGSCAGPATRTMDLEDATVLPGLIDVHTHAIEWTKGLLREEIDANYPGVRTIAQILEKVRSRAASLPAGGWIVGFGWDDGKLEERRYITRKDLDSASGGHPAYLTHVTGHLGVANSAALSLAGITRDAPDPPGGVIERDASGEPTGILKEAAAMSLVTRHIPPDPPDLAERAAVLVSQKAVEVGLTSIHDIWLSPEDMRGYQAAHQKGMLKVRVQMVPGIGKVSDAEQLVRMGLHTGFGDDRLKLGAVKFFADGGMGARTIAIYDPPVEGEPGNLGILIWKSDDLQKAHRIVATEGWQIVTHAIGDRAMDQVLDSYAALIRTLNLKDPRLRIAHGGISTPAIQKRLKEQNIIVDGNPAFVYWIGRYFARYGAERTRWSYPGASYFANGIVVGAGSDVSVTPISPWWGISAAVNRVELFSGKTIAPEERLTIQQALSLYTRNGAYIGFEEKEKGSLEVGKLADFIVVDRDVFSVPSEQLRDVRVLKTFVAGKLVFGGRQ
jgi:hypothetical protein